MFPSKSRSSSGIKYSYWTCSVHQRTLWLVTENFRGNTVLVISVYGLCPFIITSDSKKRVSEKWSAFLTFPRFSDRWESVANWEVLSTARYNWPSDSHHVSITETSFCMRLSSPFNVVFRGGCAYKLLFFEPRKREIRKLPIYSDSLIRTQVIQFKAQSVLQFLPRAFNFASVLTSRFQLQLFM